MLKAGIGTIKWFDRENKRGVIAPLETGRKESPTDDLYFEVGDAEALLLKVGQLVQFVVATDSPAGPEAKEVTVLSQNA